MKTLKVMCVISWILIGLAGIGMLLIVNDGEFNGIAAWGTIVYAFYGVMTFKIQQFMKLEK